MSFSRPGAIDLSALKTPAEGASNITGSFVIEATESNFQTEVLEASNRHVVVLNLWSPRSPQATEFNQRIATAANSYNGRILLANVDVDANAAIAQAVGAKGVPFVLGLIKGQPVPLFQSTVDDAELRQVFDQLIQAAVQNGLSGTATPTADTDQPADEQPEDPRFAAADAAFAAGDLETAILEYEKLETQYPADGEIAERLAGIRLMVRVRDVDSQSARKAAGDDREDVEAQLVVADLDISGGHIDDAFDRLIDLVRRTSDDERDRIRERLIELFTVVGSDDSRVATARRSLATALF